MYDIHCGMQKKLSKTMGSPLDTMREIISSWYPYPIDKTKTRKVFDLPRLSIFSNDKVWDSG